MITRQHISWSAFGVANIATWVVYLRLWMSDHYFQILLGLALLTLLMAGLVIVSTKGRGRALVVLLAGLAIGQWWAVQIVLFQLFWKANQFAP